ncbi:uncharacterized protein LOC129403582 [Sorex araneus]|uniref:uncharacterized protein LOC129403582 n=1 Tax=Sorex araneus TaxID=42254 RepID=UPI002433C62F|nr:uncharacterized protein LOC129403582 [Sorex araneus]
MWLLCAPSLLALQNDNWENGGGQPSHFTLRRTGLGFQGGPESMHNAKPHQRERNSFPGKGRDPPSSQMEEDPSPGPSPRAIQPPLPGRGWSQGWWQGTGCYALDKTRKQGTSPLLGDLGPSGAKRQGVPFQGRRRAEREETTSACLVQARGHFLMPFKNIQHRGWSNSTVGRAFALHLADPGSNPSIPYGPPSTARSNCRVYGPNPCATLGVTQKEKKKHSAYHGDNNDLLSRCHQGQAKGAEVAECRSRLAQEREGRPGRLRWKVLWAASRLLAGSPRKRWPKNKAKVPSKAKTHFALSCTLGLLWLPFFPFSLFSPNSISKNS